MRKINDTGDDDDDETHSCLYAVFFEGKMWYYMLNV